MSRTTSFCIPILILLSIAAFAQNSKTPPDDWYVLDPEKDRFQGVSAERAYAELLQGRQARTIIVAVIDSGVDIDHEDLKDVIWTNEKEIPSNGIDDDKNGYVDDIHGWNFIGGKTANVNEDTYEITREYVRLKEKFGGVDESSIPRKQKSEFQQYKVTKDKFEKRKAKEVQQYDVLQQQYRLYKNIEQNLIRSNDTLKLVLGKEKLTPSDLDQYRTNEPTLLFSKGLLTRMLKTTEQNDIDSLLLELRESVEYFKSGVDEYKVIVEVGYNENHDSRKVVGDNYKDVNEKVYGNNDVKGEFCEHGTHVAGVIAADRGNEIGIKGIAGHVRIMSVRTVPNGDERDKDVANAIRYAVDNGAQIINMSFGKSFSPQKEAVDQAVRYAEKKGVLLVHASGNDHQDIDADREYPSRYFIDNKEAKNWLDVGASSWGADGSLVANFSNYGKRSVDLFAPGVEIYSPEPGNKYTRVDGTSFSSPVVAGVAAMVWSYFPDLTVTQLIDILKQSTRKFDGLKVQKPGGGKASFSDLSNTGGMVNAYEAVKLAIAKKGQFVEK